MNLTLDHISILFFCAINFIKSSAKIIFKWPPKILFKKSNNQIDTMNPVSFWNTVYMWFLLSNLIEKYPRERICSSQTSGYFQIDWYWGKLWRNIVIIHWNYHKDFLAHVMLIMVLDFKIIKVSLSCILCCLSSQSVIQDSGSPKCKDVSLLYLQIYSC